MSFDKRWETDIYKKSLQVNKYPFDHVVSTVFRHLGKKDRSQVHVLEVGCGSGNNIAFLAQEGFRATGVDGSQSAIDLGREFLASRNLEAKLECFDFTDLSRYPDESFDMVIDRGSITHNSRAGIEKCLSQIPRILKKDGIFLSHMFSSAHSGVKFGNPQGDGSYIGFSQGYLKGHEFVFFFATPQDVEEFYGKRFKVLSQIHNIMDECTVKDDVRAMWWMTCQKA